MSRRVWIQGNAFPPQVDRIRSTKTARRMLNEKKDQARDGESPSGLTRRNFVALSLAAGLGAVAASASGKELPVVETDVNVTTADGICDAVFIHPVKGSHPGLLGC